MSPEKQLLVKQFNVLFSKEQFLKLETIWSTKFNALKVYNLGYKCNFGVQVPWVTRPSAYLQFLAAS